MPYQLIVPMAVHVALAAFLYVLLTLVRAPTIWGIGRRPDGSNPWARIEPRISANLSNQFEWLMHAPLARKAGVQPATLEAIAAGRQPRDVPGDEAAAFFNEEASRLLPASARFVDACLAMPINDRQPNGADS